MIQWFNQKSIQLNYNDTDEERNEKLNSIKPLNEIVAEYAKELEAEDQDFCKELVLWALTINKKLDKSESQSSFTFDGAGIGQYFRN